MTRHRLTLSVAEPARSAGFYRTFFGCDPVTVAPEAVVFDLSDPPLVVRLERPASGPVTPVASQGFRLVDRAAVVAYRDRLHGAGVKTQTQECTHCGYHEQIKVHVRDPDGHYWHLFAVDREIHPTTIHRCVEGPEAHLPAGPVHARWEAPEYGFSGRIPHADGELDEVRVGGELSESLAAEAFRVLRAWGRTQVAGGTVADAAVLRAAGFRGVEARDGGLVGLNPAPTGAARLVIYKGPFREARDESGTRYPRGRRVWVSEETWTLLRRGSASNQFLFLYPHPVAPKRPDLAELEQPV